MSENRLTGKYSVINAEQKVKNNRRFHGLRYGLRGPNASGPLHIVPEVTGFMAFPKSEDLEADDKGILD